jgi:hypothetical protein
VVHPFTHDSSEPLATALENGPFHFVALEYRMHAAADGLVSARTKQMQT